MGNHTSLNHILRHSNAAVQHVHTAIKDLTDQWKAHGVEEGTGYATLTDIIYYTWTGLTAREYKHLKGLKQENLRDNMTNEELVMNMLAELTTSNITKEEHPATMSEHARGIRTSIFCIADMNYASTDEIKIKNFKGLLSTDENNRVIRPKMAYNACRNLVSVYDNLGTALDSARVKISLSEVSADTAAHQSWPDDKDLYGSAATLHPVQYLFADSGTGLQSVVYWRGGAAPVKARHGWFRTVFKDVPYTIPPSLSATLRLLPIFICKKVKMQVGNTRKFIKLAY